MLNYFLKPIARWSTVGFFALLGLQASTAMAAPTTFFGENLNPGGLVVGDPVTARNSFLSNLPSGVGTEDFESFNNGDTQPLNLVFPGSTGNITATLTGQGIVDGPNPNCCGRFNTSSSGNPGLWWEVSGVFNLAFSDPIAAFGFFATDIGDFNGQVTMDLTRSSDNGVTHLVIPNTLNGPNASLLFFGFIDAGETYTNISFGNTATGSDFFGFDDMTIGDLRQVQQGGGSVPEPGTLAILGLGIAGLAAMRRRRKAV